MKFGRSNSLGEGHQFFKIKDLHFFRNLLWKHDFSLIKDFLHNSLDILNMEPQCSYKMDHNYTYVVGQQAIIRLYERESIIIKAGYPIPVIYDEITAGNRFSVNRIRNKTVLILQELYFLDIELTNGMKSSEKLAFLELCELEELHFNSFAYRKGQTIDSIYYLLSGQIKLFKELAGNVYEVASLEKGRLFGLFQIKSPTKCRQLHAKAGLNHTKILKIPLKILEQKCFQDETTLQALLSGIKTQIYSVFHNTSACRKIRKDQREKENKSLQASKIQLERRLKTFESSRKIKSSVIQNLVYSKKILYKVKELNERMQNKLGKNNFIQIQNIHQIKHFNDKWKSKKEKRVTQSPQLIKCQQTNIAIDPLKRLMKYPSVQRFLGKQIRQRASVDEVIRLQRQ